MQNLLRLLGIFICVGLLIFHSIAIYVSVRSKELKKSRFMQLTLFLSFSDFAVGLEALYSYILKITYDGTFDYEIQCFLITNMVGGTIVSSLLQTLIICAERLQATYVTNIRLLKAFTGNCSVAICLVVAHALSFGRFLYMWQLSGTPSIACNTEATTTNTVLLTYDLPVALLVIAIMGSYGFVIRRIIKQKDTMVTDASNIQSTRRMRKAVTTLSMIIIVVIVSTVPRSIVAVYYYLSDSSNQSSVIIANLLVLVNPLFDPIIYGIRIKEYRNRFVFSRCKKGTTVRPFVPNTQTRST